MARSTINFEYDGKEYSLCSESIRPCSKGTPQLSVQGEVRVRNTMSEWEGSCMYMQSSKHHMR